MYASKSKNNLLRLPHGPADWYKLEPQSNQITRASEHEDCAPEVAGEAVLSLSVYICVPRLGIHVVTSVLLAEGSESRREDKCAGIVWEILYSRYILCTSQRAKPLMAVFSRPRQENIKVNTEYMSELQSPRPVVTESY